MNLREYAAKNQTQLPEEELQQNAAVVHDLKQRRQDQASAEELKQAIRRQLESGNAPEFVLSAALKCIGILTNDEEFISDCQAQLDAVYAGLEQQSFLVDNAAIAADRITEKRKTYKEKLQRDLIRQKKACTDIITGLNSTLEAIAQLDAIDGNIMDIEN